MNDGSEIQSNKDLEAFQKLLNKLQDFEKTPILSQFTYMISKVNDKLPIHDNSPSKSWSQNEIDSNLTQVKLSQNYEHEDVYNTSNSLTKNSMISSYTAMDNILYIKENVKEGWTRNVLLMTKSDEYLHQMLSITFPRERQGIGVPKLSVISEDAFTSGLRATRNSY